MTADARGEAFRRVLAQEVGAGAGAPEIADGARRVYERFAQQLSPVIGSAGVAAIFARAVHLARRDHPWLTSIPASPQGDGAFVALYSCLAAQNAATAVKGAVAVLVAVAELLSSFIGEGLTASLLQEAWPAAFPLDSRQERTR